MTPVLLKCIGKILVLEDTGEEGLPFRYGKKYSAELYDWRWVWLDRF
jgi:hypothetical protein